jgi:hypothetical protein
MNTRIISDPHEDSPKGWAICDEDSVGGTPTDAVETTALPEKSPMIGAMNTKAENRNWSQTNVP